MAVTLVGVEKPWVALLPIFDHAGGLNFPLLLMTESAAAILRSERSDLGDLLWEQEIATGRLCTLPYCIAPGAEPRVEVAEG